jgi:hypothetical protein
MTMKRVMFFTVAIVFAIAMVGCGAKAVILTPADGGKYIFEAEAMVLNECKIVDDAKASGGKAVTLLAKTSSGKFKAQVKPGNYVLDLPEFAPNDSGDAFVIVANGKQVRTFPTKSIPDDKGRFGAWVEIEKKLAFTVGSDGIAEIEFKAAEFGMSLDKFILTPAK